MSRTRRPARGSNYSHLRWGGHDLAGFQGFKAELNAVLDTTVHSWTP
jgi:hypothetical protein